MSTDRSVHVVFCGGGSGGHIAPSLAIAEHVLRQNSSAKFTFLTSARDIDLRLIESAELPQQCFQQFPLSVTRSSNRIRYGLQTADSFLQCCRLLRQIRPDAVLGTGGFASVPGLMAARIVGLPRAILEANVVAGRANRFLSRHVDKVFTGWPETPESGFRWKCPQEHTGIPLRTDFLDLVNHTGHRGDSNLQHPNADAPRILVLGGSQGARRLNALVIEAVTHSAWPLRARIIHQSGPQDVDALQKAYTSAQIDAEVKEFITDVPRALSEAHLIISRAGAIALAEISVSQRPSILVPLSSAADDHQTANAHAFAAHFSSSVVPELDADAPKRLAHETSRYLTELATSHRQIVAPNPLHCENAAERIAAWIEQVRK